MSAAPAVLAIGTAKDKFTEIAAGSLKYQSEAMFAMQAIQKNDYIFGIANKSPASVRDAVINVASIGLSLNPATSYAFLVPRDRKICLDISYQGLIKIATDTGSIRWAKAELVYSNDTFTYKGVNIPPVHEFNPFGDRGEFIGVYCVAKTSDGDFLCETMTAQEIHEIRNKSEAFKAFASGKASQCPWHDFFGEMTKKTCIKRASKTWPKSQRGDMLQNAIAILNEHEGIDFTDGSVVETKTQDQIDLEQYQALCDLYADTILAVKEGIANDDYSSAAEAWFTVGDDHETTLRIHDSLWRSTKRGGCFSTAERDIIKSSEFRKAYYGETA